jgi:hypothetical protein
MDWEVYLLNGWIQVKNEKDSSNMRTFVNLI